MYVMYVCMYVCKHESGKLHVIFFDIADAFDSLEHKIMLKEMEKLGIPQHYTEM